MGEFELSPTVALDLQDAYEFGLKRFGEAQTRRYQAEMFDCFQLLAEFPGIAGPPLKLKRREVFRFPFGSHVIVFTSSPSGVRIVAILRSSMNWQRHLRRRGI